MLLARTCEFHLFLGSCSSGHPSDITSTFLRLPWEEAKQGTSFLLTLLRRGRRASGRRERPAWACSGEKEAGRHGAWLLCGKQSWAFDFGNRAAFRAAVTDPRRGKFSPEPARWVSAVSAGQGSDPQPAVSPTDTRRLLFHYCMKDSH